MHVYMSVCSYMQRYNQFSLNTLDRKCCCVYVCCFVYLCACVCVYPCMHTYVYTANPITYVYTANPTFGDMCEKLFQSSKLTAQMSLSTETRQKRRLSSEL